MKPGDTVTIPDFARDVWKTIWHCKRLARKFTVRGVFIQGKRETLQLSTGKHTLYVFSEFCSKVTK